MSPGRPVRRCHRVDDGGEQITTTITRILVPFDFGEASVHALGLAKSMGERFKARFIVMGRHGRGAMAHLFLGGVAERIVRTAPARC